MKEAATPGHRLPALLIELGESICKCNLQRCATAQPAPLFEVVADLLH
jgi:hypothetical protein